MAPLLPPRKRHADTALAPPKLRARTAGQPPSGAPVFARTHAEQTPNTRRTFAVCSAGVRQNPRPEPEPGVGHLTPSAHLTRWVTWPYAGKRRSFAKRYAWAGANERPKKVGKALVKTAPKTDTKTTPTWPTL